MFNIEKMEAAIVLLSEIKNNFNEFITETQRPGKAKNVYGLLQVLCKQVLAENHKRQLQHITKTLDKRLLSQTGINRLREYREKESQSLGGSMPMLAPRRGECMVINSGQNLIAGTDQHTDSSLALTADVSDEIEIQQFIVSNGKLYNSQFCHICHVEYHIVHHYYDQLCVSCGNLNFAKRNFNVNLSGKYAIVTGGRVKIGYCVALKLLRCGANVLVTSRFPHDASTRYVMEPDFKEWGKRLKIVGLDFRDISSVNKFCEFVKTEFQVLDILINNAAQTVRRPPAYYEHLIESEKSMKSNLVLDNSYHCYDLSLSNQRSSSALSQIPLIDGDIFTESNREVIFPTGQLDIDKQQVDLRVKNSWTMKLDEVTTTEMIECHVINAFAPFILCSSLKDLMKADSSQPKRILDGRYIVNVSAMEGQFYRHKTANHPHTNMAKAAMNMMTRTSAQDYVEDGIYMNSADTGWITDEHPKEKTTMYTGCPLDEWDAAMRILDCVFLGISDPKQRHYGVFFKNYFPTKW